MSGCFKVFHTPKESKTRDICEENIKKYMSLYLPELETPTIRITNSEQVKDFLLTTPEFKLNYQGWDPDFYGQYKKNEARPSGWLYGAIGIWASNFYAWKKFLATEHDYLLIFENDVILDDNFFQLFTTYLEELPEDWEVFHQYVPDTTFQQKKRAKSISDNISVSYQTWSNAVYAISRKGAERMMEEVGKGIYLPLDWQWFKQRKEYKTYTVRPKSSTGCKLANIRSSWQHNDSFVKLSFLEKDL
jgi:GR25 family glycosyltransferase involved in LPS biosynthesis